MRRSKIDRLWARIRVGLCATGENDRGIALVSVILLILVLSFVSGAAIVTSITELKIGGNFKTSTQSFYNAEAGVQYALGQIRTMKEAGTLNLTGSPVVVHYGAPNTTVYPLLSNGRFPYSNWTTIRLYLKSGTTDYYRFQTTGYYANANTVLQGLLYVPSPILVKGIGASGAVNIKNNLALTGSIGSNTSIDIGNPPIVATTGSSIYSGTGTGTSATALPIDPLDSAALVASHNYSASNNNAGVIVGNIISGSKTLPNGNYYLTSLTNGNLTINGSGPVNIYVANTLSLTNITINAGSGPVAIYYHGSGTVGLSNATLNSGGAASNLSIICDTGATAPVPTAATTFEFDHVPHNGGTYSAFIYAPYADLNFYNNDNVKGLLYGKTMTAKNNLTFVYDAPNTAIAGSLSSTPLLVSWKQL